MNVVSGGVVLTFFDGTYDGAGWTFKSPLQMAKHFDKNWSLLGYRLSMNLRPYPAEIFIGEEFCGKAFKSQLEIRKDFALTAGVDVLLSVAERYFSEAEALAIADDLAAAGAKNYDRKGRL